ncbi:MAG: penicillin-binding transpeptidase domain-containing protein [Pseudomonadota bacterium]
MRIERHDIEGWREYQKRIQRINRRKYLLHRLPIFGICVVSVFLAGVVIFYGSSLLLANLRRNKPLLPEEKRVSTESTPQRLERMDLPDLLKNIDQWVPPERGKYLVKKGDTKYFIETFIDPNLQEYVLALLERSLTFKAAVVVLRPQNGQILAMANYEKDTNRHKENICIKADFPAASLFKIISAAAAIEEKGFTPDTPVLFHGRKHTLYKSQLKEIKSRFSIKTNFKKAFSGSINPVFGKLGIYSLGKEFLTEYADRFFFNKAIPFDLPLAVSRFHVPEDDFGLAEIASGFNKKSLISPVHAALLAAAIVNEGVIMDPKLVNKVTDESGKPLYVAKYTKMGHIIKESPADKLKVLMEDTVKSGTCRKAFTPLIRKKIFKNMEIGAKTGTINDPTDQYKIDWITAYAFPPNNGEGICISVLAVHEEKLGIRSNDLARHIIHYYFSS